MIRRTLIGALLLACYLSQPKAQSFPGFQLQLRSPSAHAVDSDLAFPGPREDFLRDYFERSAVVPFSGSYLSMHAEQIYGLGRHELTRLDLAMEGAGKGATLGLFMGAVANTKGKWDERASWYLVGAATAIGAILGGTVGANEPEKRVRYRWQQ